MKSIFWIAVLVCGFAAVPAIAAEQGNVDPQAPCFRWPAVDMDEDGVFDRIDHCVNTMKGCTVDSWGCETDADDDGVCDGVDRCPGTPPGMKVDRYGCASSQTAGAPSSTPTPKEQERATPMPPKHTQPTSEIERQLIETGRIRLENVYFETASAKLLPESEEILREVGRTLEKFPDLNVEIEGHTDTRGSAAYNMRLSQSRSEAVRAFLVGTFKLADGQYQARGYGESRPETDEKNDEELLRNRRVVLRVLNPEVLPKGVRVEKAR